MHKKPKVYLITGATSGIGLDLAKKILLNKNHVICCGRSFEELDNFVKKKKLNNFYQKIKTDFSQLDNLKFFNKIKKVDFIVNAAGFVEHNLIKFFNIKIFLKLINVNLIFPISVVSELYKKDKIVDNGKIVFISSLLNVKKTMIGTLGYGVAKSGVDASVRSFALEMAKKNIRVNAVAPGMVDTNLVNNSKTISKDLLERDKKRYPIDGRYAKTSEVSNLILYLLSEKSDFITGQTFILDGGFSLT